MKKLEMGMHVIEFTFKIGSTSYHSKKDIYIRHDISDTKTAFELIDEELADFRKNGISVVKATIL